MLEDGRYDVIVVDADDDDGIIVLDLAVLAGSHKGAVVTVRATGLAGDPTDLLGTPGTLVVTDGEPDVVLEP